MFHGEDRVICRLPVSLMPVYSYATDCGGTSGVVIARSSGVGIIAMQHRSASFLLKWKQAERLHNVQPKSVIYPLICMAMIEVYTDEYVLR